MEFKLYAVETVVSECGGRVQQVIPWIHKDRGEGQTTIPVADLVENYDRLDRWDKDGAEIYLSEFLTYQEMTNFLAILLLKLEIAPGVVIRADEIRIRELELPIHFDRSCQMVNSVEDILESGKSCYIEIPGTEILGVKFHHSGCWPKRENGPAMLKTPQSQAIDNVLAKAM